MEISIDESFETKVTESLVWVNSSKKEFITLRDARKKLPPQKAVESFVIGVEKLSKAVAIAAGFNWMDVENYGHKSLKLHSDLLKKLLSLSVSKTIVDTLKGKIVDDNDDLLFLSYEEAMDSLQQIRSRITVNRNRELSEWAYEWATLPKEKIANLVTAQLKLHKQFKFGGFIFSLLPIKFFLRHNVDSKFIGKNIVSGMRMRGFQKSDELKKLFDSEVVSSKFSQITEEEKLLIFKNSKLFMMSAWVIGVLWILTPLTSPHGMSFRYPSQASLDHNPCILSEKDYTKNLGIVDSLNYLFKLFRVLIKETEESIPVIVSMFIEAEDKKLQESTSPYST